MLDRNNFCNRTFFYSQTKFILTEINLWTHAAMSLLGKQSSVPTAVHEGFRYQPLVWVHAEPPDRPFCKSGASKSVARCFWTIRNLRISISEIAKESVRTWTFWKRKLSNSRDKVLKQHEIHCVLCWTPDGLSPHDFSPDMLSTYGLRPCN